MTLLTLRTTLENLEIPAIAPPADPKTINRGRILGEIPFAFITDYNISKFLYKFCNAPRFFITSFSASPMLLFEDDDE